LPGAPLSHIDQSGCWRKKFSENLENFRISGFSVAGRRLVGGGDFYCGMRGQDSGRHFMAVLCRASGLFQNGPGDGPDKGLTLILHTPGGCYKLQRGARDGQGGGRSTRRINAAGTRGGREAATAVQGLSSQSAINEVCLSASWSAHARPSARAVGTQSVRDGSDLEDQVVRSVGCGAREAGCELYPPRA